MSKQVVRCHILTIAKKLRVDVRISVDDRFSAMFSSTYDDAKNTSITIYPSIGVQLLKPGGVDENGKVVRAPWNPNDNLGMTKYNFPIFVNELAGIQQDMKTPNLYTYQGKRLELNEEVAAKIRRVFVIGNMMIELSAVVITQDDSVEGVDARVEGIKMKFNNEQSSVQLTLNELNSFVWNLEHTDIDTLCMLMYLNFVNKPTHPRNFDSAGAIAPKPEVDIEPLKKAFASEDDDIG